MNKSNLKNIKPKAIKLTLNGREFDFILNLNSFAELEDQFGGINDLMEKMEKGSAKAIRAMIWAGLLNNENPPSISDVGNFLNMSDLQNISMVIAEAMGAALPDAGESDPN